MNKILLNVLALYMKNILTLLVSLWSVPLILKALGASDYGLYNLVAGVVSMLAFLNSAMTVSTQRYISVYMGKNDKSLLIKVYNTSLALHLIIGFSLVVLLEICGFFLFDGFLNITSERLGVAKIVYQFIIVSTFLSIISVPYSAVMIAHEDLFVFSIIGIITSILKLGLAFLLYVILLDKLIVYAFGIALISVLDTLSCRTYVHLRYREHKQGIKQYFDKKLFNEMFGFTGWNTFGAIAVLGRNQGIAIVLNKFFGTIVNAAYGIANQIIGALTTFSSVLQQSINPQLMKSEGMNDRDRMLRISYFSSKISVLVLSIMAVPLFVEAPFVLDIWLGEYPIDTLEFTRLVIFLSIICQYSVGIMSAIQSGGVIGKYQFTMSLMILSSLLLGILLLSLGFPSYSVIVGFICLELVTMIIRLLFAKNLVNYDIKYFLIHVFFRTIPPVVIAYYAGRLTVVLVPSSFSRLILTCVVCVTSFICTSWVFSFGRLEKEIVKNIFNKIKIRKK